MAIAHSNSPPVARLLAALGLERVRSLTLSAEVGSVVAVVTEQFVTGDQLDRLANELETKRWVLVPKAEWEAIRRLADQDATLSVCDGNVTVTMDATLTDAEREAVAWAAKQMQYIRADNAAATLRGLLERMK